MHIIINKIWEVEMGKELKSVKKIDSLIRA